jgi:hypothetical protein
MVLAQNRCEDQGNRKEDAVTDPHSYSCAIFDKGTKIHWREKQPLLQLVLGKLDICIIKTETRSLVFTLYNSKFGRLETLKLLQEVIGETLEFTGIGNNFLTRTPILNN